VVLDGSPSTIWTASKPGKQWLGFDLGEEHKLTRCVIRHAGEAALNTRDFALQASSDGKGWKTIYLQKGNKDSVTDVELQAVSGRYLKLLIDNPGSDQIVRIADLEIYGMK
jgi:hypothetical protein